MTAASPPPITPLEYERLFRTIHGVISNEQGDPTRACLFFGIGGARLLRQHHGFKDACHVVGFAGYNLGAAAKSPLAFGTVENGVLVARANAFHCWVEADGWVIDLTAPLFDALVPVGRKDAAIPPRMFQKAISGMARTGDGLNAPGAYLHIPDATLTGELTDQFFRREAYADLVNIFAGWYIRPPAEMPISCSIANQRGEISQAHLSEIRVLDAW